MKTKGDIALQHFNHLEETEREKLFYKMPQPFSRATEKEKLSYALGAALYIPAVHPKLLEYLVQRKYQALTTLVICLEDGIADDQVALAEERVAQLFVALEQAIYDGRVKEAELPLLFVRTRSTEQLEKLLENKQLLNGVTGFCLPKFNSFQGKQQLQAIHKAGQLLQKPLYAMPILETKAVIDLATSQEELEALKGLMDHYQASILNVRIGATDFSSLYGIRRTIDSTIYDITVLRECMARIINVFGKAEDGYVISGPVWEFFSSNSRLLKPELRQTPFKRQGNKGAICRRELLDKAEDGLIKEILLDKVNGLCGKTIIHPSHITYVNALQTVTREEYEDARQILGTNSCGVIKSTCHNKMNEIKPHTNWALKIIKKAEIYGVINEDEDYTALF